LSISTSSSILKVMGEAVKEKAKISPGAFQPLTNRGRRHMLRAHFGKLKRSYP
jgi:hypothetical protein